MKSDTTGKLRSLVGLACAMFLMPATALAGEVVPSTDPVADSLAELATGVNTVWMLLAAMLVFFMQPVLLWWKLALPARRIPPTSR